MLEKYTASYETIAQRLVPELPPGWRDACVLAEMRADNGMVVGFARVGSSSEPTWLDLPATLYDAFRAMHDAARDGADPAQIWTSASLRLRSDGAFDVNYGYEPVPLDEQTERIDAWTQRSLRG